MGRPSKATTLTRPEEKLPSHILYQSVHLLSGTFHFMDIATRTVQQKRNIPESLVDAYLPYTEAQPTREKGSLEAKLKFIKTGMPSIRNLPLRVRPMCSCTNQVKRDLTVKALKT